MGDWQVVATTTSGGLGFGVGNGLNLTGTLLSVKAGQSIAFDGSGNLTVNAGVGLSVSSGGFLQVATGTGLGTSGGNVVIPGGAITNAMLAALSVAQANIQAGAVGTTQIAAAAITTALIANAAITNALIGTAAVGTANIQNAAITNALVASIDAGKITTGTLTVGLGLNTNGITTTINNANVGGVPSGLVVANNGNSSQSIIQSSAIVINNSSGQAGISIGALPTAGVITITTGSTSVAAAITLSANAGVTFASSVPSFTCNCPSISGTHLQNLGTGDTPTFADILVGPFFGSAAGHVICDYGTGIRVGSYVGSGGTVPGTYGNGILVYDHSGTFKGTIPLF